MGLSNEEAAPLSLPSTNAFVQLQLLNGGSFSASTAKLHAGVKDEQFRMYNWAFYIHSPVGNRHVLWDFGMTGVFQLPSFICQHCTDFQRAQSQNRVDYTPFVQKFMLDEVLPVGPSRSIVQQLSEKHSIGSKQVDTVIFR